uniref:Uncharacterized protein n=1 Tax=Rhizophora mucronata TaxID=61149 RepID=A0A2P2R357_RHIMU
MIGKLEEEATACNSLQNLHSLMPDEV